MRNLLEAVFLRAMQLFFDANIQPGLQELAPEEAKHAIQVLRHQVGDTLTIVDGRGGWYAGRILAANKRHCQLEVALLRQETQRAPYKSTIAIAPPKSGDRFEWFLEKATEIGIDAIQPIISQHSERRSLRPDRLLKVLESAMKQSAQAWLPKLLPLLPLEKVLTQDSQQHQLIAWINEGVKSSIAHNYQPGTDVCIFIGPEGGFSSEEAQMALAAGCQAVSLGPNRLRTETAGVVAAQSIVQINWPG